MEKTNIFQIEGMEFPAGRRTRVVIGENGAIKGEQFCQGYVVIYRDGAVPEHEHENVETYTILQGEGKMQVGDEIQAVKAGDCIFIPRGARHSLHNSGDSEMHMMFVYAPSDIVDHWDKEKSGEC